MTNGTDDTAEPATIEHPWRLILLLLLTFVALSAAMLPLPHDRYIRYQQLSRSIQFQLIWGYERTTFDKTPIDIAVIGNSRLGAAVSAPQLQEELSRRLGRPVHVANLALPQEGRNAQYAVAKRLFETHPEVKLVILSAIEQMPRTSHPAFRNIADVDDVVGAPRLINTEYFNDLAFMPYRQMSLFAQTQWPAAFGNRVKPDQSYIGERFDSTVSFDTPTGNHVDRDLIHSDAELRPPARARAESATPPLLPGAPDLEFRMERDYTRKIADLARANGTKVAFLYTPIYHYVSPVQDAAFYRSMGPLITADFLAPDPRNYSDYGHANRIGTQRLTLWLGDWLIRHDLIAAVAAPQAGR